MEGISAIQILDLKHWSEISSDNQAPIRLLVAITDPAIYHMTPEPFLDLQIGVPQSLSDWQIAKSYFQVMVPE